MIAEILAEAYDPLGKKVFRPDLKRRGLNPTAPMGRYVQAPLTVRCRSIGEIRQFLSRCRSVSDQEQFGRKDYWQPPDEFEKNRKGDCDDFALWTWRQFDTLGFKSRIVFGAHGRYGTGHAWVQFARDGKYFLVEPQFARIGDHFPRLSTLNYKPKWSAEVADNRVVFYAHEKRVRLPAVWRFPGLILDWLIFWSWVGTWVAVCFPRIIWRRVLKAHLG